MIKVDIRNNSILQKIFNKDLVSIEEIIEKLEDYYIEGENNEE